MKQQARQFVKRRYRGRDHVTGSQVLENIFYEMKPFVYVASTLLILKYGHVATSSIVKMATIGIIAFTSFVIYARLNYRGYISSGRK